MRSVLSWFVKLSEAFRRSSEGLRKCDRRWENELETGRLRLVLSSRTAVEDDALPSSTSKSSESTPREIESRSSTQAVFCVMRDDKFRAWVSSDVSVGEWMSRAPSAAFTLECVVIEDWRSVFDISSACTLRASSESKYGSAEPARVRCLSLWGERGVDRLRGEGIGCVE
jgi:hypothetical protein